MTNYNKELLKKILEDAVELTSEVPENSRGDVLPLLVNHMLETVSGIRPDKQKTSKNDEESPEDSNNVETDSTNSTPKWEKQVYDGLPEPHEVAEGTRQEQALWAVIKLNQQGKPADVNGVRETIQTQLGVSPETVGNTSGTLGSLMPAHLTREKEGRGYIYSPNRHSLDVFDN